MVERSDRAPLLDWEEVPSGTSPAADHVKDRLSSPSNSRSSSGCSAPAFGGWSGGAGGPAPGRDGCDAAPATGSDAEQHLSDSGPREAPLEDRMVKWEEKDQIVSVFVVTFNTRSGKHALLRGMKHEGNG